MSFIAPLMFALGGAIMAGIVAMYLLRLRREERTVSSTFLWNQLVRDIEANAPWQRLRHNWLLWLQLLIALLLGLALARPFFATSGVSGRNLILIIDRSASMGATDVGENRLAAAKAEAIRLVDQLPDGARATVMAIGGELDVPAAATTDRRELRNAINGITLRLGGGSDMEQALNLAGALAAREAESEVAILTDGQVTVPTSATLPAKIRYFPVGADGNNQAVAAVSLSELAPGSLTFFARVRNESSESVRRRLTVQLDGQLFKAYDLEIPPGQEQTVTEDVAATAQTVEARLDGADSLPSDDVAWAVRPSTDPIPVRLVTPGNRFLATGLGLMPRVQVNAYLTETATFTDTPVLTVLDASLPDPLPEGNLLFIAPYRSTEYFSVTGALDRPVPRPAPTDDPLLRNVELGEINILRAGRIENAPWSHNVIDSASGSLLIAGEINGRRIAVLGFDLHDSDLPLNIAFPLLLSNLVGYLAPGSGGESANVPPDQPLVIPLASDIAEVQITRPDGSVVACDAEPDEERPCLIKDSVATLDGSATNQAGIYVAAIRRGGETIATQRYVVNGYSESEAVITPVQVLDIAQIDGQVVGSKETEQAQAGKDEWWRPLALIAFVVLLIEWIVAQRGGLTRLRLWWRTRRAAQG
ncbi:MAG TPA: BatA and WFA domain-containing protein [Herpetosiphonaceae bacterium]